MEVNGEEPCRVVAADSDDVRARFGHARGNDATPEPETSLRRFGARIHGAQVVDQLARSSML